MKDARLRRFWHRAGPLVCLTALATTAAAAGCGGGGTTAGTGGSASTGDTTGTTMTGQPTASSGTATMSGGTGGGSSAGLSFGLAADVPSAFDATPDLDGKTIYLTSLGPSTAPFPGVYQAPGDGSATTPKAVAVGDPFVSPFGIAISTDGKQLFVADPGADAGNDKGAIFVVPVGGGAPVALMGSEDALPRSLEVAQEGGKDVVFFTGTDKSDGQPGVFKIPATGGAVTAVLKGAPFRDPAGIAIAKNGDLYVADTVASARNTADILVISGGKATPVLQGVHVGYPCGVALTTDDSALFISALDPSTLTDMVIKVTLATKATDTISQGIDTFSEAAGLHRAKNANVFGWADSSAGTTGGKVFVVK